MAVLPQPPGLFGSSLCSSDCLIVCLFVGLLSFAVLFDVGAVTFQLVLEEALCEWLIIVRVRIVSCDSARFAQFYHLHSSSYVVMFQPYGVQLCARTPLRAHEI